MKLPKLILGAILILPVLSCGRTPPNLTPLAPPPDWLRLEAFQETITHDEFVNLLKSVYAEQGTVPIFIRLFPDHAQIQKSNFRPRDVFTLHFAVSPETSKPPLNYRQPVSLSSNSKEKPLGGLKIALDPGHIGGKWAKLEQRWFQVGNSPPVAEGDLNLLVAKFLELKLESLGAEVQLVRDNSNPVTSLRPEDLRVQAKQYLEDREISPIIESYREDSDPLKENSIQWASELLAYQIGEIRERSKIINEKIKPDLTLCLHFDAQRWPDPKTPSLIHWNQAHLLIPGSYTPEELRFEDVRLDMLFKLLSRSHLTELVLAEKMAQAMAMITNLPPGNYPPEAHVRRVGSTSYVWTRNLLANRLYWNPVIYLEPYVMNDEEVFQRIQTGDYEGERFVAGAWRKSIFREYAEAVTAGLVDYYANLPTSFTSQR